MAEDSDLEKSESPSPRRLEQAREEGQVPQSRDLSTFFVTVVGVATLWALGGWIAERMFGIVRHSFAFDRQLAFDSSMLLNQVQSLFSDALLMLMPLFLTLMIMAVASPVVLGGLVFSSKALGPNFGRLNPLQGMKRMFSTHGLVEMLKAILKAALVGGVGGTVLWKQQDHLLDLIVEPLEVGMADFADSVLFTALLITTSLGLLALIDVPFQLWQYYSKLRMTKEEVRRESKEQDGDPQLKGRIRSMQREMARRRMMSAVPQADVVITNPSHFAVALQYDAEKMGADHRCQGPRRTGIEDSRVGEGAQRTPIRGAASGPRTVCELRTGTGHPQHAVYGSGRGHGLCLSIERLDFRWRRSARGANRFACARGDGPRRSRRMNHKR